MPHMLVYVVINRIAFHRQAVGRAARQQAGSPTTKRGAHLN